VTASALQHRLQQGLHEQPPGPLVVAYSGGLDSTVLLHLLAGLDTVRERGLRALHVDHRLSAHSSDWAASCQAVCAGLGIECRVLAVDVTADGRGLEAAARDARYRAFDSDLMAEETLVLAHHRDDQAETILLRLLRGSGAAALAGMPSARALGHARLWRPLLEIGRDALLAYAKVHALQWIDDPANLDPRHDRNALRHQVLPLLRERWPRAERALAASARLLQEDAALIDQLAAQSLAQVQGLDPRTLSLPALRALPEALIRHVVRRWLDVLGMPAPPASILRLLGPQLLDVAADREPRLRWAQVELRRYRDLLYAGPLRAAAGDWSVDWDGSTPLPLPHGGFLELSPAGSRLPLMQVGSRRGGERIRLPGRPSRTLRNLLQELGVPPWERERLPLLFAADNELLAAGDLLISTRLEQLLDASGLGLRWLPAGFD
jgi:tRNA(Ile)-lysidine synthase